MHDLAESLVGDLVPNEVTKDEKYKREKVMEQQDSTGMFFHALTFSFSGSDGSHKRIGSKRGKGS